MHLTFTEDEAQSLIDAMALAYSATLHVLDPANETHFDDTARTHVTAKHEEWRRIAQRIADAHNAAQHTTSATTYGDRH